jgi:hypothetical protein
MMMQITESTQTHGRPEIPIASLGKKCDVATMLKVSLRTVDNFIAQGCPFIKPTPRCCRFDLLEVKEWFKSKYGQQRRKNYS